MTLTLLTRRPAARRGALGALTPGALLLGALLAQAGGASAECLRTVANRSAYVLVASRDGGPPVTLLPGQSVPLRLAQSGTIAVAAYCALPEPGRPGEQIAQATFDTVVALDRCFIRFGGELFRRQIGGGMLGTQGTAPFTVNNPRQGDLILGPFESRCPVLSRGG